ncbi:MAG: phosphoglucosamine mutase [Candidatus Thermoplasmatota archaeon]
MRLFGSSGIRGVVNEKITPELCRKVGRAVGESHDSVIMGRDARSTGDMVSSALTAGLTSAGANVKKAGMLSTSSLAHAAEDFDCGVMVTASHNPEEYNGIKMWNPDGSSFNTEQMHEIEEKIFSDKDLPGWKNVGSVRRYDNAVEEHISSILDLVGDGFDQKVIIDCANGSGSTITPFLLKRMGCEVTTLNAQPDGSFPAHPSEPVKENLADLSTVVEKSDADLGIAHDGDADRTVAVDREGNQLGGDELLKLFVSAHSSSVVVPVNSSMAVDDIADEVFRCRVGDVFVSEMLKEKNAAFGGEPSGTWIFPEISDGPDGIYAAALLVKMNSKRELSQEVKELPSYPRRKAAIQVKKKEEAMEKLISLYENTYSEKELNLADGIRLEREKGWSLIRASGTEPKIRITAEARDEKSLDVIFERAKNDLEDCLEDIR